MSTVTCVLSTDWER